MCVSGSGFVLFFYDVLVVPPHGLAIMATAWLLMLAAVVMAVWAVELLPDASDRRDFAVGALQTTCTLPLFILVLAVAWMYLYNLNVSGWTVLRAG